jgi:myo-inositol-1(or 4)-monophosphatase
MDFAGFILAQLKETTVIANNRFGKVSNTTKADDNNQVLTETDLEIGNLLINRIKATYPDHNIIDEEAGVIDNKSEFTWVTDPIDGTSNFANGVPTYGIMIGLLERGSPIAGGISLPSFLEIVTAQKGQGAFINKNKISVSKETNLLKSLIAYGIDGHQENPDMTADEMKLIGKIVLGIRNLRSSNSAFDAVMVAKGKYGGYLNKTSKIWDNVAQQIIIEEAGGIYTDFYGHRIDYSNPLTKAKDNFTWCGASPILHKQLQEIINK